MKISKRQLRKLIHESVLKEDNPFSTAYKYYSKKSIGDVADDVAGLGRDLAMPDIVAEKVNEYRSELLNQVEKETEQIIEDLIMQSIEEAFEQVDFVSMIPEEYSEYSEYIEPLARGANEYLRDMKEDVDKVAQESADCVKKVVSRTVRTKLELAFPALDKFGG